MGRGSPAHTVAGGALRPTVADAGGPQQQEQQQPPHPAPLAIDGVDVGDLVPLDLDDDVDSDTQPAHRDLKAEAKLNKL